MGFKVTIESATSLHRAALWRQRSPGRLISACTFPVFNWFFFLALTHFDSMLELFQAVYLTFSSPLFFISLAPTTVSHTIRHKNHNRQLGLEFTFPSSQTASQDIMQATLNLFLLNGQRLKQFKNVEFIDIEISVQMANASSQEVYEKHRLIPVERQENVEGKNFPINITKLVKAWYNSKEEKHKIFFSVSNSMTSEKLPIRIIASDLNNLATVSKNV